MAIDNDTGEVKAMVGGTDFNARPFNLATNGHRQPGSAIKPFILVARARGRRRPEQHLGLAAEGLPGPELARREVRRSSNYEDSYLGSASLWSATAASDNSVFAELGLKTGTKRIARLARRMGIRTKMSTNPAMTLGGLEEGVTPLEMAYAYSTIANEGKRISSSFAARRDGPIGFDEVKQHGRDEKNEVSRVRVFPQQVGALAKEMLHLVVTSGTGKAAQVGDEYIWGKTGTTENYGDAWFVGGNDDMTVAVWVGYPDKVQSMEYEHAGGPVAGGTFPAEIFHDFLTSWLRSATSGGSPTASTRGRRHDDRDGAGRADADGRPERRPRGRAADAAGARRPRRYGRRRPGSARCRPGARAADADAAAAADAGRARSHPHPAAPDRRQRPVAA